MDFDFSSDSNFPSSPEASLCSSFKFSDYASPKDSDGFDPFGPELRCSSSNPEMENKASDASDRLPVDPFDMKFRSNFTAITGWVENLKEEMVSGFHDIDLMEEADISHQIPFAELNCVWNESSGYKKIGGNSIPYDSFTGVLIDNEHNSDNVADNTMEEFHGFGMDGNPPEALEYALHYMGSKELLTLERVCRSLREAIKSDWLLWRSIQIAWPSGGGITDDALLQMTSRAQGGLECLILVECTRITDRAIREVLENNKKLTKLSVPGCTGLSIDAILSNLRAFKSTGISGIKRLRIGGVSMVLVTNKQFKEMKLLLEADTREQKRAREPQFYQISRYRKLILCDDDRPIDIESCPRCERLELVYDCPVESCQKKVPRCRACVNCIRRCIRCGRCFKD